MKKAKLIFETESLAYKQLMILGAISYKVKGNEVTGIDSKGKKIQTIIIKKIC
jgi:hypothetical protein